MHLKSSIVRVPALGVNFLTREEGEGRGFSFARLVEEERMGVDLLERCRLLEVDDLERELLGEEVEGDIREVGGVISRVRVATVVVIEDIEGRLPKIP